MQKVEAPCLQFNCRFEKSRLRQPRVRRGETVALRQRRLMCEFIALNLASTRFHRGLVSPPKTPGHFATFLQRSNRKDSVCLFICLKPDGAIIGAISLGQIFRGGFQNAYLYRSEARRPGLHDGSPATCASVRLRSFEATPPRSKHSAGKCGLDCTSQTCRV